MAEYISREELIKALETGYNHSWHSKPQGVEEYVEGARGEYDDVLKIVCGMKAADVQPVVRCENCKYYTNNINDLNLRKGFCNRVERNYFDMRLPNDYCSCGAKMDGGE